MQDELLTANKTTHQLQSVTGAIWQMREVNEGAVREMVQSYDVPEIVARVMISRGVALDNVARFLEPKIQNSLPDPFHLLDMDKAANRIADAIEKGEKIVIWGDYDVDGATSSALLRRFFNMLGVAAKVYIPDRIEEGYGLNTEALLALRKEGNQLCISVDCGTLSFEPIEQAQKAGLDMVVIDHHQSADTLPPAVAIVNPNRLDESSEHRYLAAVGMAFLVAVAVQSVLRERGFFEGKPKPDLLSLLDIVALGTVCDVVPLVGANRAFVSQGLKVMHARRNVGLAALADVAGVNETPSAYHLGFVLGPRINAGGRVGQANLGSELLATDDPEYAAHIAEKLNHFNHERKAIETLVQDEAMAQAENAPQDAPLLFAAGKGWHPGVIGIVASRLKEKYNKPTAVIALDENGIGKASARSISGIDFGAAVISANLSGLLLAGGGHAMAAGFTVEEAKIPQLFEFLCERFAHGADLCGRRVWKLDGNLTARGANVELLQALARVAPFGTANAEPRFCLNQVYVVKADVVGADHVRAIVADKNGGKGAGSVKCMAFRSLETPIGKTLLNAGGKTLSLAGKAKLNVWQGRESVDFIIDDVAVVG